jgi:hypothetical protein
VGQREALLGLDHRQLALRSGKREPHLTALVGGERSLRELDEDLV